MPSESSNEPEHEFAWTPGQKDIDRLSVALQPPLDPTPFMLLKGHLLIEEYLKGIVTTASRIEGWPFERTINFGGLVLIIKKQKLLPQGLIDAIYLLNKVRNDYAHKFSETITQRHVEFIAEPLGPEIQQQLAEARRSDTTVKAQFLIVLIAILVRLMSSRLLLSSPAFLKVQRKWEKRSQEWYIVRVSSDEVVRGDIAGTVALLRRLSSSREIAEASEGKLCLLFEEFGTGLAYEFSEFASNPLLRSFIAQLDSEFPYWFFFHELETDSLKCIFLSLVNAHPGTDGKSWILEPQETLDFNLSHIAALEELCDDLQLPKDKYLKRITPVLEYFRQGTE